MNIKNVGQFITELRKEAHYTQEQLGEKIGVTNKTVSRWENGNYVPPVDILLQLSDLYSISINEILSGKRLKEEEYKENAENNIKNALEGLESKNKRWMKIFYSFSIISTLIAMFIILSIPKITSKAEDYKIESILVILAVVLLWFIATVLNGCFYISKKEKC